MKTVQVFLSHTSDMAQFPEGRTFVQAALDAVGRARMSPVDMRYFAARDGMPVDYCREQVRACDIYVAIIGFRYGSIVAGEGVSYTETEFLAASSAGLPRLVFLLAGNARPAGLTDADIGLVEGFRKRLLGAGLLVREFASSDSLELEIFHALTELGGSPQGASANELELPSTSVTASRGPELSGDGGGTESSLPSSLPVAGGMEGDRVLAGRSALPGRRWRRSRTGASPAQVPAEPPGFAGRARELRRLQSLLPGDPGDADGKSLSCPVALITGTAGVGKTTLAIRFARMAAPLFPDGQLYVNLRGFDPASQPVRPGTALRWFFDALGVPALNVPSALEAQSALLRTLLNGKRVLLLLDNARDTGQVRPLLPASPGCMVVVTSRSQLSGLVVAEGAQPLPLVVLNAGEATELLARRLGPERVKAEPGAAAALVRQSAGLPLALSVACARAATRASVRLADLTAELADARGRLDALSTGEVTTDLRAVFSWSTDKLSDPAARTFRLLGLHPGPEITVTATASLTAAPVIQARAALAELARASLLTEDVTGRFSCHDLLRAYAAELASATLSTAERDLAGERVLDHYVRSAHAAAARLYPARGQVPLPSPADGVSAVIAYSENAVGWILAHLGQPEAGLQHCRRALEMHSESGSRTGIADTLDSIAYAYGQLADYEQSTAHYQRSIEMYRLLGDLHGEAGSRLHLGDVQHASGQPAAARRTWEETLALLARVPGADTSEVLNRIAALPAD